MHGQAMAVIQSWLFVLVHMLSLYSGYVAGLDCGNNALGMQNGVVPADKITASSERADDRARLNYVYGSWCAVRGDDNPYLQIDLGTPHIICAVSTQGDQQTEQWVKSFKLNYSDDGNAYYPYKENGNVLRIFYSNVDSSGIVKQILYQGIIARYLRILPMMHHGGVCMRAEIYGIQMQSENLALNKTAIQSSTNHNGTASRAVDGNRDGNWLGGSCTHCNVREGENEWWRVDLGKSVEVEEVSVFTRTHPEYALRLWNSTFELRIEDGAEHPKPNPRCGGQYGIIPAGSITIVCNPPMKGRYVTIIQQETKGSLSLCEVEVYGQAPVCVRQSIGISSKQVISDNSLTASSSSHENTRSAAKGRLFGYSSWRPRDDDHNPWLQIDLGEIYYVCAVATQGDPITDERTTKYNISWSLNNTWHFVRNKTSQEIMIFTGNRDSSSIIKHIFTTLLKAKMIRFYPVEKNMAYALRVEIYGVNIRGTSASKRIGDIVLDPRYESHVDLVCRADGGLNIKWYHNYTDITSYSIDTMGTGSILMSTLRVNYTSADDVYDKYSCGKVITKKRHCSSLEYLCYVDYGSYERYQTSGTVTVLLGVPSPPIVEIQNQSRSAALIMITQPNRTADQGKITKYTITVDEKRIADTNQSNYYLPDLEPYTKYTIRVMASSKIGNSLWSAPVTFTTLQAEPTGAPKNLKATKKEYGIFEISWDEIPQEHANGEIVTYEITWEPVNMKRKRMRRAIVPPSGAKNATRSPHLLDGLWLNVTYNVRIRGYTKAGPGPFSKPITINKETKTKDGPSSVPSSLSASESFMLTVIIVAAVVSALVIIMIVMIVIIVLRKRNKKRNEKVKRVRYTAGASEPDAGVSLIEGREENDEQKDRSNAEDVAPSVAIYGNLLNPAEATKSPVPVGQFIEYMRKVGKNGNETLKKEFENMENGQQFPSVVARKLVNKTKNRYGNIVPYDHTRVVLEKVEEDEDSDYINASYIRGFDGRHVSYIASQGPVTKTIEDFWRMIWQEKTSVIVMLTGLVEGHKTKCEQYWPEDHETYLDISVQMQKTEVFADYSIRSFYLTKIKTNEQRCVFQYHFTAWPDKGVPQYATQLLAFRRRLVSDTAMVCPWVVHCSAGVGRTGAFIAVDAMLRQAQEKKTIDIFYFVKTMRENRPYMVQTPEQYVFVHTAILEFLTCGITEIRAQQLREEMNKLAKVDENENLSGYEMEFKHLSHVCPPVQDDEITAGKNPCNNRKNRFPNIVPLDKARVFLQVDVDEEGANYINASYANGYRQKHAYILTQAPLDNTIADFWKMIYDNKLGTIVMLNTLQEGDENYPTYWPQEESEQCGDITVEIIKKEDKNSVTARTLHLTCRSDASDEVHEVRHYQHTDWTDGSVPSDKRSVLDLIEMSQRSQQQSGNNSIVVQCSDGVGRSGTLCTILSLLDRVKTEQMVDVFQTVKALRISRPGAVENAVQYKFCFELVKAYLDSFSDYSNFND